MTPSPSPRNAPARPILTPGLDELLPTTRMPSLMPVTPMPRPAPSPEAPAPAIDKASARSTSSSWDLKPGRWIKALPASYRTPHKTRAKIAEWARDEAAVGSALGVACGAVGFALVIGALVYGATGLSRTALAGAPSSVAIAMVLGRVIIALVAAASGHAMIRLAERVLKK